MRGFRVAAWAVVVALVAGTLVVATPVFARAPNPAAICSADQLPTQWTDDLHPPTTIRVRRSKGPDAGSVETVNFWDYVATVLRTEYATGANKPPVWMRIGALTVKQYAWYYTIHWRGGRVTVTNPDGSTTVECYDVQDNTNDQIYRPEKWNAGTSSWVPTNVPTLANYRAMAETWNISLRKWITKKNLSRLFLSGYRSGRQKPCGTDSRGFKIYQKSLRDCGLKDLTLEETIRQYFEPKLLMVNARSHDVLADDGAWMGDFGLLTPLGGGGTQWRLYPGTDNGFADPAVGTFSQSIVGYGVGNVDSPAGDVDQTGNYTLPETSDPNLLADLVMLSADAKLLVAHANGDLATAYDAPIATDISGGGVDGLVVGDFNGDLLADAGLLRTIAPGTVTLSVMLSHGDGTFSAESTWWSGPLDLTAADVFVAAADVNGDGKADLVMRDANDPTGTYYAALSPASCSPIGPWGPCSPDAIGPAGLADATPMLETAWAASDVKNVIGDFDRDGRDDVIAVVNDGNGGINIYGMRSQPDGTLANPLLLAQMGSVPWSGLGVAALDINADGMADLALVQKDGSMTKVQWLQTSEKSKTSAAKMTATQVYHDANLTWSQSIQPY